MDTETSGLDWFADDFPFIATSSGRERDKLYKFPQDNDKLRADILDADQLIFHNASFDIHMLVSAGVVTLEEILGKRIEDTDLLARCVLGAQNGPFGLKHLATLYVDSNARAEEEAMEELMVQLGLIKKVGQRTKPPCAYLTTWEAYPKAVEAYAIKDTRYTFELFFVLMQMANEDALKVYDLERRLMPTIIRMEHRGIRIEQARVESLRVEYELIRERSLHELERANDYQELNFSSPKQVADFLLGQGVPLTATTDKTGELRVDKWVLERFETSHPIVGTLLENRQAEKFLGTYIEPMVGREYVHTSLWQMGAGTGRMSCSRPNLQNIPQRSGTEVREIFIPRDGHCFLVADYSSIELRVLAYYMNSPELWDVINNGDAFVWLGTQIYGTDDQSQWPVKRQSLKNGFYAMTYGAGGPKLAATIGGGMTPDEGRELARMMKATLGPEYRQLTSKIQTAVSRGLPLKTLERRAQYIPTDKGYVGLNYLIQGSASDIMKRALILTSERLAVHGAYPLLPVHDEILAECPIENAEPALRELECAMVDACPEIPMKVEGVICHNSYAEGK